MSTASLRITRTSSRHLPNPADDRLMVETNGRTLGLSIAMAQELRDALTAVLDGAPEWKNEEYVVMERAALPQRTAALPIVDLEDLGL